MGKFEILTLWFLVGVILVLHFVLLVVVLSHV